MTSGTFNYYYPSINGAEVADAQRSEVYPCAHFTGSITDTAQNVVYAWRSPYYEGANFVNNRQPGELYLTGGDDPAPSGTPIDPGPYVAKVDATTGDQIWRTYLNNANTNDDWVATTNLNTLPNGNILFSFERQVVLLDGDTGLILKHNNLDPGAAGNNASFKHVLLAPDGTAIIKDQVRATGCTMQSTMALFNCPASDTQENSVIYALDSNTLEILDSIDAPDNLITPPTITMYDGKIAYYGSGNNGLYRWFWDPTTKKLSQDMSWVPDYLLPGQTVGDAPGIMGDWVVVQMNGKPSQVPSTITAISASDPTNIQRVTPFGDLKSGQQSWAPPKNATDVENMITLSADQGQQGVAAIKLDPDTGAMTTMYTLPLNTLAFQTIIGPTDQRVAIFSNMTEDQTQEQVVWVDLMTGTELARSDWNEPMMGGALMTPGYGGRLYFITPSGFIVYWVTTSPPAPTPAPTPTPSS
jgi:hypothetical protein